MLAHLHIFPPPWNASTQHRTFGPCTRRLAATRGGSGEYRTAQGLQGVAHIAFSLLDLDANSTSWSCHPTDKLQLQGITRPGSVEWVASYAMDR